MASVAGEWNRERFDWKYSVIGPARDCDASAKLKRWLSWAVIKELKKNRNQCLSKKRDEDEDRRCNIFLVKHIGK